MSTQTQSITWSTNATSTTDIVVGDTVTLNITLVGSGQGAAYTPAVGDYIILSNGGHAVYNGTAWVYTVAAGDAPTTNLDYAGSGGKVVYYHSSGSITYTSNPNGGLNLPSYPASGPYDVICFLAGTMIATPTGEVAVEELKAGDLVMLANGGSAAVTWLGRQTVSTVFADPLRVQPIRVMANALADGMPSRDLLISPDHALLVDGMLVAARALVNDVSIVRETIAEEKFIYYHVEVADHALILADNTPVETFIDNVSRMNFDNWDEHPGDAALVEMDLPRAKAVRQVPSNIRSHLAERGEMLFGKKIQAA
ncbi:MAG: Hint domain-containing protein [Proteobacteria bacterium]|nr:Hint domain-containing protein [Pseudomonadota bacterium]MBU6425029.1 Hint domain-containing protein [Rhodospirillales bacterium]